VTAAQQREIFVVDTSAVFCKEKQR